MAFPHDQDGAGDIKSFRRAIWADDSSLLLSVSGGKLFAALGNGWGSADFNWDDSEGWSPRINYWGSSEKKPFNKLSYPTTNDTDISYVSKTGLISLRRKNEGAVGSTTGTSGRVIAITNGRTSGEVYTSGSHHWNNSAAGIISRTPANQTWHCSWYARKSTSDPTNDNTVRMTVFCFGVNWDVGEGRYVYNFSGNSGGNAGSSTVTSPDTGHTYYYKQVTLTTAWTKYEMTFVLNGDTDIDALSMRIDNDDGLYGTDGVNVGSKIYIDRITLHPIDPTFRTSVFDGTSGEHKLDDASWDTYST